MTQTPSPAELDAAERVLAEAAGQSPDGFWRPTAEAVLQAARKCKPESLKPGGPLEELCRRARQRGGILPMNLSGRQARYIEAVLDFDEEVIAGSQPQCCRILLDRLSRREDFLRCYMGCAPSAQPEG